MISELVGIFDYLTTFAENSILDLSETEMVEQRLGVPNHAAWTIGHIIFSCQEIAVELGTKRWLPESWESKYGYGSAPSSERLEYPSKQVLMKLFADSTSRLRAALLESDELFLSKRLSDDDFPTMTHLLLQVVIGHTSYHIGQLAVWRRAIGKETAGVFI